MTTYSIILAWKIPWTGAWWAIVHGVAELDMTERPILSRALWSWLTENPFLMHMFVEENFVSWLPDGH